MTKIKSVLPVLHPACHALCWWDCARRGSCRSGSVHRAGGSRRHPDEALQFNDNPSPDFGIAQTWNFAHPRNRAMTGPLPRFASMLKGPAYGLMLNHASHRIVPVPSNDNRANFDVFMETGSGQVLYFNWAVELVEGGEFDNCWMTVAVSMPRLAGQGS